MGFSILPETDLEDSRKAAEELRVKIESSSEAAAGFQGVQYKKVT